MKGELFFTGNVASAGKAWRRVWRHKFIIMVVLQIISAFYDANNNTNQITDKVAGVTHTTKYAVDPDNRPTDTTWTAGLDLKAETSYDVLGRTIEKQLLKGTTPNEIAFNTVTYSYLQGINGSSTSKVGTVTDGGVATSYTYDPNGNIATITTGGQTITYFYDELNQLIRENNQARDMTTTYSYDIGGNLTEKNTYTYTTADPIAQTPTSTIPYIYGDANWKDKLTSFNGNAITYDNVGNPLTYAGYTYTWEDGRQLAGISGNSKTISYSYNDQGIRQSKTVNATTTTYRLVGDRVSWEGNGTDSIYYTYDGSGNLVSMNLNGTEYFYTRNLQGDVTGLIDNGGAQVVTYTYDSWGSVLSTTGTLADTLGQKNPYRYRGYRLDAETGMYYLNSRYYVPEWGRFLNADVLNALGVAPMELTDKNLYSYCDNNPVSRTDANGKFWFAVVGAAAGIGGIVSLVADIATQLIFTHKWDWKQSAVAFAAGAISGAFATIPGGAALTVTVGVAVNAALGAGSCALVQKLNGRDPDGVSVIAAGVLGAGGGGIGSAIRSAVTPAMRKIGMKLIGQGEKYIAKGVSSSAKGTIKKGYRYVDEGISKMILFGRMSGVNSGIGSFSAIFAGNYWSSSK